MADPDLNKQDKNPIAVALSHEKGSSRAPIVTASGRGELAEQILKIAFENGVKVREDADLAQILTQIEVDSPIPLEAFAAVSEIMAYLYKAQNDSQPPTEFEVTENSNEE
ncbi:EscU/YscU/HrcU family type III secretion system export apparatus switch protein [Sneathiella glossodoripedis]|uniref:EscU/YscU/HrcU family type III secretion system export apparatus switch protein n=1 Tax=Sneathiella glossodoripedis TaxID=418853 RepID=UPI000471C32D|nr:EscU/YscU/HrcU family type III secretion system export apparatus switch protein [Sneathiella glossodoripedis]